MTTKMKARGGRPSVTLDPDQVQDLAARGLSYEQIALSLGINFKTLLSHRRNREEIQEAIDHGRAKGLKEVSNALYQAATNGNITAQIFYLKNRDPENWKDRFDQRINVQTDITLLHLEAMKALSAVPIEAEVIEDHHNPALGYTSDDES